MKFPTPDKWIGCLIALLLFVVYSVTAPQNHTEAEDVYDFASRVEQGTFSEQAGVNRLLALPAFGAAYKAAQAMGYPGRAFPFMICINRLLSVASVFLFYRLLLTAKRRNPAWPESESPRDLHPTCNGNHVPAALLLAFSYGFWRYANEAETYILAGVFVLGAWCLAVNGRWIWCMGVSAFGILVHLLNLVPLLLIIPIYYLLSKEWKKAVMHGVLTGVLVGMGYGLCFTFLDWRELGAHHHSIEAELNFSNLFRGGIGFGQCLLSGNFLFGFELFRAMLERLFPSRMLAEEFFMASHMYGWIKWAGCLTLVALGCVVIWGVWKKADDKRLYREVRKRSLLSRLSDLGPLRLSVIAWFFLYAFVVIHTEAGSPELWIMALIPFWLMVAPVLHEAWREAKGSGEMGPFYERISTFRSPFWWLVAALFLHNLVGGLMPVMSIQTDYEAAKGKWIVENSSRDDLVLTDYEPIMIFYLNYYAKGMLLNSGAMELNEIERLVRSRTGKVYAFASFFQPMTSMEKRYPKMYQKMLETGGALRPMFGKIEDDEFGGIYVMEKMEEMSE